MLALLCLAGYTGIIKVDGVDISRLSRSTIRQNCFISVPQDPFTSLSATLRWNIDPTLQASDDVIVEALKKVRVLPHLIRGRPDARSILDKSLSQLPVLSTGQSQLLCLARAIVRRQIICFGAGPRPILLLDEATACLDPETEPMIYDVINEAFMGHTIIIVAHKMGALSGGLRSWADMFIHLQDGTVERVSTT